MSSLAVGLCMPAVVAESVVMAVAAPAPARATASPTVSVVISRVLKAPPPQVDMFAECYAG
jgi:hypothetical protein